MAAVLIFSFLVGMKHALEADHVAAVASLAAGSRHLGETARVAAAWGVGLTLALVFFGALLIGLDISLPESASAVA